MRFRIFVLFLFVAFCSIGNAQVAYRLTEDEVEDLLEEIEKSADHFRESLDDALDRSGIDDTRAEDNINQFVKDFESATDNLKDRFGENRSADADVEEVLQRAGVIDRFMSRHRLGRQAEQDWANVRHLLDQLAAGYDVTWGWDGLSNQPRRLTDKQVKALLSQIENNADYFRKSLDRTLDRSRLNGTRLEDEINDYVEEFEDATDVLEDRYDEDDAALEAVREVLRRGQLIDRFIYRHLSGSVAERDWAVVRRDLGRLAGGYNVFWRW